METSKKKNQLLIFYHCPCADGAYSAMATFLFLKSIEGEGDIPFNQLLMHAFKKHKELQNPKNLKELISKTLEEKKGTSQK